MQEDVRILRELARELYALSVSEHNVELLKLHKAVNDLKPVRPVVLIDELPWSEMNFNGDLTMRCTDPCLRHFEWYFLTALFQHKYMPADTLISGFVPVGKVTHSTGIGISVEEDVLATDKDNSIVSHRYMDILATEDDLQKIQMRLLSYDKEETLRIYNLIGDIVGDILPVRICGTPVIYFNPWDWISVYRGVTNLLIDLTERQEFMHRIIQKLTDLMLSEIEQMEALDLLDYSHGTLHCTPIHTDALPGKALSGVNLTRRNVWGRGAAQIFGSVSKAMHEEFDIEYQKKVLGSCGLVYYGCCEPLDTKIDIVEKIPNLRKISITPWANVDIAAEAINTKYVLSAKPNPAAVAVSTLDKDHLKKEIGRILAACKRNSCACDIVLKDISTCCKRPQNIFEWEQTVMEMVKEY